MFTHLKGVIIHQLREGWDRRGLLMTIEFEAVPNQDYQHPQCINLVRTIVSLLAPHYSAERYDEYDFTEINDCWIDYSQAMPEDEPGVARIRVRHKYWSDSQIECFIIMMTALAKRYNAEVIDERGGDI
jgi:hypothetical protein